jgi:hypothetical protein
MSQRIGRVCVDSARIAPKILPCGSVVWGDGRESKSSTSRSAPEPLLVSSIRLGGVSDPFMPLRLFSWCLQSLHAQTTNGSIQGSVTDPNGAAIWEPALRRKLIPVLPKRRRRPNWHLFSSNLLPSRYAITVRPLILRNITRRRYGRNRPRYRWHFDAAWRRLR